MFHLYVIRCCWGDFYEWICAVRNASSTAQETQSSKVYRIWLQRPTWPQKYLIGSNALWDLIGSNALWDSVFPWHNLLDHITFWCLAICCHCPITNWLWCDQAKWMELTNIDLEIEPNKGNKSFVLFCFALFWQSFNRS